MGAGGVIRSTFEEVGCPDLSHRIDYDAEQVTMSVPRRCVGRPEWVRVGLSSLIFRGEADGDFGEITDNPHSTGAEGSLTRRLHRAAG